MTWLAALALPLLLLFAGRFLVPPAEGEGAAGRAVTALLAGMVGFGLLLGVLTWCGIPWYPAVVLITPWLAAVAARQAWRRLGRGPAGIDPHGPVPAEPRWPSDFGWGDAVALLALLAFALLAVTEWITTPDFVYHWGIKAEHFFLARGADWQFLAESWNYVVHPDYPHLLPSLYAATALLAGRFHAPSLMLWSVLFQGLTLLVAREAWRVAGVGRAARQAGIAFLGLALTAYCVAYLVAGGADQMIALALVAGLPPLLGSAGWGPRAGLRLGIVAAFAATSKMEGLPLAGFLVGAFLLGAWRHGPRSWRARWQTAAAAALPSAVAVTPWLIGIQRHRLFQPSNDGPLNWSRSDEILPAMLESAWTPELHGLPWLVVLVPLLALWPGRRAGRVRLFTLVASAQLLFYFLAYFASTLDARFYVLSSFARLLFQLLPAAVIAAIAIMGAVAGTRTGETPRTDVSGTALSAGGEV